MADRKLIEVMISIGRKRIGGTSVGEGIWPLGARADQRSRIRSKDINTTCSEKLLLPRPNTEARIHHVAGSSRANINFLYSYMRLRPSLLNQRHRECSPPGSITHPSAPVPSLLLHKQQAFPPPSCIHISLPP